MKTAIFIDGANNYAAAKAVHVDIDYSRLLAYFNKDKSLVRAYYYTALVENEDGINTLRPLIDFLSYNGYDVVAKKAKTFFDSTTGITKVKGNMDMELAVDAMRLAPKLDDVIIFSGDGDFTYLVKALQQEGCRVMVVSTLEGGMIADELRRAADTFIDLKEIIQGICRDPSESRPRRLHPRT